MKKLTGALLALILIFSLSACSLAGLSDLLDSVLEETEPRTPEASVLITEEPVTYGPYIFDRSNEIPASRHLKYYDLDDTQKELYDRLIKGIANLELRIEIDPHWKAGEADEAFTAVYEILGNNNPEFFWYPPTSSRSTDSDGTYSVRFGYWVNGKLFKAEKDDSGEIVYPSEEEIAEAKAWIKTGLSAIRRVIYDLPIHAGMTAFELEVAVHDWLCDNIEYDKNAPNKSNMYGALVEGRATCAGYSQAFEYIMRLMGIESLQYSGYLDEDFDIGHAWSAVKLDGQWYQVDVTSDATAGKSISEPRYHQYFNRTDEFMARNHTITEERLSWNPRIICGATRYDYYRRTDTYIMSDDDFASKAPGIIAKARAAGAPTFELEFAQDWAAASEISDKKKLIDKKYWNDITFYYLTDGTLVFGWFD